MRSPVPPAQRAPCRAGGRWLRLEPGAPPAPGRQAGRGGALWGGVVVLYVALAVVSNLPVWVHGVTHEIQNQGGDLAQAAWLLAVTP